MGDHHHGHAVVGQTAHHAQDVTDELGVEGGRRLVEKHQFRIHRQRTRDGHALLLTARELHRVRVGLVGQPDLIEQLHRTIRRRVRLDALDVHRGLDDVAQHSAMREQVEILEDHADVGALLRGVAGRNLVEDAVALAVADQLAVDVQAAGVDLLEVIDAAQQRRLARTRGADEAGDRAARDLEIDALEHLQAAEGLAHVAGLDHGAGGAGGCGMGGVGGVGGAHRGSSS